MSITKKCPLQEQKRMHLYCMKQVKKDTLMSGSVQAA